MFIDFLEKETERERVEEGQREREPRNWKQAPRSELSAHSPMKGLNSQTERS